MPDVRMVRMAASSSGAMGDEDTGIAKGCGSAGVVEQAANVIVSTTISTAPSRPVMVATLNCKRRLGLRVTRMRQPSGLVTRSGVGRSTGPPEAPLERAPRNSQPERLGSARTDREADQKR